MTLDYFYGQAGELFSFYRIPKALFQEPRFQNLSTDAKTLYGILLDRMSLSAKNGWLDEQGRVFIIFTIEDVKRALCCADNKATKLLRELEKFGLIERKRRGLGKPSLVYVKNFSAESSKSIFQNRDFHDSGGFKNASQDPSKSRCNKTKENDTEMSETDPFYSEEADGMSKRTQLEEYFSQSLEVELLLRLCPDDEDTIYQIVDLLVDTCATNRKLLRIAGDDKPAEVVRSRFMKLNADHIRFVLKCLAENSSPIRNMKQYLLASLYNAPTTMQLVYQGRRCRPYGKQESRTFLQGAQRTGACAAGQHCKNGSRYKRPDASCGSASSGCRLASVGYDPAQWQNHPSRQSKQTSVRL